MRLRGKERLGEPNLFPVGRSCGAQTMSMIAEINGICSASGRLQRERWRTTPRLISTPETTQSIRQGPLTPKYVVS
jgi:hypothetical protein